MSTGVTSGWGPAARRNAWTRTRDTTTPSWTASTIPNCWRPSAQVSKTHARRHTHTQVSYTCIHARQFMKGELWCDGIAPVSHICAPRVVPLSDLNRTFPDNVQFRKSSEPCLQKALYDVLLAYGHHNPAIGYCQVTGGQHVLILTCLSVCLSVYSSVFMLACLSVCLSCCSHLSVFVSLSACLSFCLPDQAQPDVALCVFTFHPYCYLPRITVPSGGVPLP